MTSRRAHLPSITQTEGASTSRTPGTPLIEDQIRDYRRTAHARYEAQRIGKNIANIGRSIVGRQPREHTLALLMDPEVELRRSMQERARTVPAEVLYMTRRDNIHHRVYHYRSEERMLVIGSGQQDRTFIEEDSFERLAQTEIEYIHLGILQVRFQILHRRYAGTLALVVFRDTRWGADGRSIIAAMEVDLAEGNQLIYIMPDIMMTIKDFYRHIQISICTKGYDSWEGAEANLLITRSITARLSNTPNVGFAFRINKVAEYLRSKGVKAIDAAKHSAKQRQTEGWNLRPSSVVIPTLPTSMMTTTNYDGSTSLRFGDHQASSSSHGPKYNQHDDETDEEMHLVNVISIQETPCIRVKRLTPTAILPQQRALGAAGYDLFINEEVQVPAHQQYLVKTGVSLEIPEGYYARIAARPGSRLHFIINTDVIDSKFRGEVGIPLFNCANTTLFLTQGSCIAQLIFERVMTPQLIRVEDQSIVRQTPEEFDATTSGD